MTENRSPVERAVEVDMNWLRRLLHICHPPEVPEPWGPPAIWICKKCGRWWESIYAFDPVDLAGMPGDAGEYEWHRMERR